MIIKNKKCENCGNIFEPNSNSQKVCDICKISICPTCGKRFNNKVCRKDGKQNTYCSNKCYLKARWGEENKVTGKCPTCGKEYESYLSDNKKYCSSICYWEKSRNISICITCNKKFESCNYERKKYCSRECYDNRPKKFKTYICAFCGMKFNRKLNGKTNNKFCSIKCMRDSRSVNYKDWSNCHNQGGENNPSWAGGKTPLLKKQRASKEYSEWRDKIFKRDNYTCQDCKIKNVKLNAHHKEGFAKYENLRFDINNGITLCEKCHGERHNKKWGVAKWNLKQ
jgi:hypothetical protein